MFELRPYRKSSVSYYNPFREMADLERSFWGDPDSRNARAEFKADITDEGDHFLLEADLPGFKKEEVSLELNNGYLTISTEKSLEKDKENKKGKMLRQERYSGVMQRSFYVGEHLTEEDEKASYENGVLHIKFPKKEALKAPEKKTILIEG